MGLNGLKVGGIEGRDDEGNLSGDLEADFSAILLNYSQHVTPNLGIGVNGKVITGDLGGEKENALSLDLGLLYLRGNWGKP